MVFFLSVLALYIDDNENNITFVGPNCLFVAVVVTRAINKQYALQN